MKLGTIRINNPRDEKEARDGRLVVISGDNERFVVAPEPYTTLLCALEMWKDAEPVLSDLARSLEKSGGAKVDTTQFMAPLPRTYAWLDGSAYIQHVILVRKARGAEPPEGLYTVPLMYQGVSDTFLGPNEDIPLQDESWGMDFEGEIAVITDDVPMGVKASEAHKHIKLLLLMNDVSLRNLIPQELATGFGFFHGKPASAFAPFAVSPEELADCWRDGRVHLPLLSWLNGQKYGEPDAGEMHFSFGQLIEHAAKTRRLSAGTIVGSGTVSNKDETKGSSCLAEKRMLEKINRGEITTPFMKWGDKIELDMVKDGKSIFGRISQTVKRYLP